jgi:hypothetical protein
VPRRAWPRLFRLFFSRSSEAFIGICEPTQHVLGDAFIHLLCASEHLSCAAMPMDRIVIRHDSRDQRNLIRPDAAVQIDVDIFYFRQRRSLSKKIISKREKNAPLGSIKLLRSFLLRRRDEPINEPIADLVVLNCRLDRLTSHQVHERSR